MLNTLLRIVMILAAFGLVAGSTYILVNSAGSSTLGGPQRPEFDQSGSLPDRPAPDGAPGGHDGEDGGFSINGLTGVLVQLAKVGLITMLVTGIQTVLKKMRRGRCQPHGQAGTA